MDRGAAISGKYTTSGNDYKKPDDHANSSRRGRSGNGTVEWRNTPNTYPPRGKGFYNTSGACSSHYPSRRTVKPIQDFSDLITPENIAHLTTISDKFGACYDGKTHSQFANSIKQYTSNSKRPLSRDQISQLIPSLQTFKPKQQSWSWRSLTTTLHSLTSAGVFTPHKHMDETVKHSQANLLSTLLDVIKLKCNQKPEPNDNDIDAQGIANLLWAMAKLVDNGQERTAELNAAVAALLPHVNAQKASFKPQEVANLLWAMAKLVDNGQERTAELKATVAALLPHVNAQKEQFIPQHIANLLWAMAKLVDNGQERTAELKAAVAALLPHVNAQKDQFNAQGIANLLWAMAKLVDNGQERTAELNAAVAALLPHVNAQKDQFNAQGIANLLWAMAKLVDNGQERTAELKAAVAALFPHVNAQKASFKPQEVANLLWAMAKLVDNGQERTAELNAAVAALLPHVNAQKASFKPQEVANLLWAMAKLVDNGQERTAELKAAVAALLPHVNAQKDQFNAQGIANLLWAMAKLGEAIELSLVESTFESLVYISENPQLPQQETLMSLWGVMVCCARLSLSSNATKNNLLEKLIVNLFTRLENIYPDNQDDQTIIAMAASWLSRTCRVVPHYQTTVSTSQSTFRDQLRSRIPSLKIKEEESLYSLPPVDLLLPDHGIVIEVQGPSHYVGGDFKTRNGSTLLRIALLQKLGFNVIEIPVNKLGNHELMGMVIDQIRAKPSIPPEARGSVSLKSGGGMSHA